MKMLPLLMLAASGADSSAVERPMPTASPPGVELRLDAITIEGDIDVPQVLFLAVRDRGDGPHPLHRTYLVDPDSIGPVRTVTALRWPLPVAVREVPEE